MRPQRSKMNHSLAEFPAFLHFGTGDLLQKMFDVIGRWRAANSEDYSHFI